MVVVVVLVVVVDSRWLCSVVFDCRVNNNNNINMLFPGPLVGTR